MRRYIDADKLLTDELTHTLTIGCGRSSGKVVVFVEDIEKQPTADVVEVVRCKDCEHWHNEGYDMLINQGFGSCTCKYWEHPTEYFEMAENDFCSYGKRREK